MNFSSNKVFFVVQRCHELKMPSMLFLFLDAFFSLDLRSKQAHIRQKIPSSMRKISRLSVFAVKLNVVT